MEELCLPIRKANCLLLLAMAPERGPYWASCICLCECHLLMVVCVRTPARFISISCLSLVVRAVQQLFDLLSFEGLFRPSFPVSGGS